MLLIPLSGCASISDTSASAQSEADFHSLNFQWGFIEHVYQTDNFDDFFRAFLYFQEELGASGLFLFPRIPAEESPEKPEQFMRHMLSQAHASRYDYLSDFDYLIDVLNMELDISNYLAAEIAFTRQLIQDFFHVNDIIFFEFIWEGIFYSMENAGLASAGALPLNITNWDFGDYFDPDELAQVLYEMSSISIEDGIPLPKTNFLVVLHR